MSRHKALAALAAMAAFGGWDTEPLRDRQRKRLQEHHVGPKRTGNPEADQTALARAAAKRAMRRAKRLVDEGRVLEIPRYLRKGDD